MKKLTMTAVAVLFCLSSAARADRARSTTISSGSHEKFWVGVDGDFALPIGSYADGNGVGGSLLVGGGDPGRPGLSATARIGFPHPPRKKALRPSPHRPPLP